MFQTGTYLPNGDDTMSHKQTKYLANVHVLDVVDAHYSSAQLFNAMLSNVWKFFRLEYMYHPQ